jgi:hypothetical protein
MREWVILIPTLIFGKRWPGILASAHGAGGKRQPHYSATPGGVI